MNFIYSYIKLYYPMDQKLLAALNNLSEGLEAIAAALSSSGNDNKSATTEALQKGDFITEIKEINVGVKQLIQDSKQILKNQETIISLSKKKSSGDKKSDFEKAGGDPKKESELKKGVGTILLIAVAVLAIGMAFKLVGGINFLSVIGLSIAILIIAEAFKKVAALKLSLKEAAVTASALVLMSIAVTVSSWILKKITPIGFKQVLTMILIGVGFSLLSPAIGKIIGAFSGMSWGAVIKSAIGLVMVLPAIALGMTLASEQLNKLTPIGFKQVLTMILIGVGFSMLSPAIGKIIGAFKYMSWGQVIKSVAGLVLVLPAIALGITLSSWILKKITPISFTQALSAIFIAAMFTVVSYGINKLLTALGGNSIGTMLKAIVFLPLILPAIALGIVLSSYILKKTQPIGLAQAWGAIMVAFIFTVISFGLKNIIQAMGKVNMKSALMIPLVLPLIALAIVLSSKLLSMVKPITFMQFITAIAISLVFVVIGFAVKLIGKSLDGMKWSSVVKMPVLFTLVSLAIMLSSHILSKTKAPSISETIKMALFGIALGIIIAVMMIPFVIISKFKIGIADIVKGTIAIIAIATAIMISSHIIGMGQYGKYPSIAWSLGAGTAILIFGLAVLGLGAAIMLSAGLGLPAIALGAVAVVIVAASIAASSHIIAKGKYDKHPGIAWSLSVGGLMIAFGAAMLILGVMPKIVIKDGAHAIKEVAKSIVVTDKEVRKGKYDKYPSIGWSVTVSALMLGYAVGMAALGILPKIVVKDGIVALKEVAKSIVTTDKEVSKGKYDKYPGIGWSVTVSALMLGYAAGMAVLGILPKMIVRDGIWALKEVAKSIVTTDRVVRKGKYDRYPGIGWSVTVSALMLGYAAGMAVLGILPKMIVRDGIWALKEVAKSILTTDRMVSRGKYKTFPGSEWAITIGLLMTAWSAGVSILGLLPKFIIKDGTWAVKEVAKSIVSTGYIFTKNSGVFKNGPTKEWAEGVSLAIGAFGQVYSLVLQAGAINAIFGGKIKPGDFGIAIKTISSGIVEAAKFFGDPKLSAVWKPGPTKAWAEGIGLAIGAFSPVYGMLLENAPGFLSKGGGVGPEDFAKAVVAVSYGIIAAAEVFEKNASKFEEGKYPSVKWGQGVGAALKAFAPVFKSLHEDVGMFSDGDEVIGNMIKGIVGIALGIVAVGQEFEWANLKWDSTPTKAWSWNISKAIKSYTLLASGISSFIEDTDLNGPKRVVNSIISVGKAISKNKKYLSSILNPLFVPNLSIGIKGYTRLTNYVAGSFGVLMNDSGVKDLVVQMVITAKILDKNKKYLSYLMPTGFVSNLSHSLLGYAVMARKIEALMTIKTKEKSFGFDITNTKNVDLSHVNRLAMQMAITAKIVGGNAKYFNNKIDPNFMKSVSSNLFYYMAVANKLKSSQGGLGSFIKGAIMGDPMTNMANGMILLSKAYDKLASSITKMGSAMNNINDKKLSQMERMSRINTKTDSRGVFSSVGGAIGSAVGSAANAMRSAVNINPVNSKSTKSLTEKVKLGKYGDIYAQNDKIIDMLKELNNKIGPGSNIDTVMVDILCDKKTILF
jgi:hypothetical protein